MHKGKKHKMGGNSMSVMSFFDLISGKKRRARADAAIKSSVKPSKKK